MRQQYVPLWYHTYVCIYNNTRNAAIPTYNNGNTYVPIMHDNNTVDTIPTRQSPQAPPPRLMWGVQPLSAMGATQQKSAGVRAKYVLCVCCLREEQTQRVAVRANTDACACYSPHDIPPVPMGNTKQQRYSGVQRSASFRTGSDVCAFPLPGCSRPLHLDASTAVLMSPLLLCPAE